MLSGFCFTLSFEYKQCWLSSWCGKQYQPQSKEMKKKTSVRSYGSPLRLVSSEEIMLSGFCFTLSFEYKQCWLSSWCGKQYQPQSKQMKKKTERGRKDKYIYVHCMQFVSRIIGGIHYYDVIMSAIASQITSVLLLFTQPFVQMQIKENIKARRHWPLCGEFTGDRWIPRTNGQQRGKCFH